MGELPWEKRFHFRDGTAVANLEELKAKVESISYDEFYRHVTQEKNDFANWIEHVLHDKELAGRLRAVSSIVETVEILDERLEPKADGGDLDLQARIESQLFAPPKPDVQEQVPTIEFEMPEEPVTGVFLDEEPRLPSKEEVAFANRMPGAPVVTHETPHTSIRELSDRHAQRHTEEQMRFVVKQFIYGFLSGLIVGFILAKAIGML